MTSSSSAPRRPVVAILILLSGVAWLIGIIDPTFLFVSGTSWLAVILAAALTLAFLFLGIGRSTRLIPRIAFLLAAVGWAILTLNDLDLLNQLHLTGVVIALAGTLLSGIFVALHRYFGRIADILFLLASILIALELLQQVVTPFLTGTAGTIVGYAEAILLALAGLFALLRK